MSNASDLNTRVQFFEFAPIPGLDPGEVEKRVLWECWAEVYEPSIKDAAVLSSPGTNYAVTIRIRNNRGEYRPDRKHYLAVIQDYYKANDEYIRFNIKEIYPDVKDKRFIKVVAEVTE